MIGLLEQTFFIMLKQFINPSQGPTQHNPQLKMQYFIPVIQLLHPVEQSHIEQLIQNGAHVAQQQLPQYKQDKNCA